MRVRFIFIMLWVAGWLTACDDGKIYETTTVMRQEGSTVKLTAEITGISQWPSGYNVALAGFGESVYAVISKDILDPGNDTGEVSVVLSGVSSEVYTIEVCVINRLRKRIATFYEVEFEGSADTIYVDAGTIDAGMFASIQENVFDNHCAGCHGNSTSAAANLFLTEGKSYEALVNVPATRSEAGKLLVVPGDAEASFLPDVLLVSDAVGHDHTDILSARTEYITLIQSWINAGAEE